jgi:8-oxo-dGTP pyrophosphatase MutT (NUDIX family)
VVGRFRVVPAAYVFLMRAESVLLQLRQNTGYRDGHWAAAGAGHVEQDESAFDAAVREAREEIGVSIEPGALRPLCAMHRTHRNHQPIDERVDFFFGCDAWVGEPRIVEPRKAAAMQWWPLADLPDPVVPHERTVLDGLRAGTLSAIVAFGF